MTQIFNQRMTARIEGDFVIFLIGMRVNTFWRFDKWFWVTTAMPKMLIELQKHPEMGLLGYRTYVNFPNVMVVQYWRSFDQLIAYATSKDAQHLPAWVKFNKQVRSDHSVGIWHESYHVQAGAYETVYANMPAFGLGKASKLIPAVGSYARASQRMHSTSAITTEQDILVN